MNVHTHTAVRCFLQSVLILLLCSLISHCGKGGGGGTPAPPVVEENLVMGIDPDPGATTASALGANYDFKVLIQSKMPAAGVKIDIVCTKDADNSTVSSQTLTGSAAQVNAVVNNLQPGVLCTVKVTVTSANKPSNTVNKSFKLARK